VANRQTWVSRQHPDPELEPSSQGQEKQEFDPVPETHASNHNPALCGSGIGTISFTLQAIPTRGQWQDSLR